jgi:hypothetical protein
VRDSGARVGTYSAQCQRKLEYRYSNIIDDRKIEDEFGDEPNYLSVNLPALLLSTGKRSKGREGRKWANFPGGRIKSDSARQHGKSFQNPLPWSFPRRSLSCVIRPISA